VVAKVPSGLGLADTASLPIAFLTAQYCLTDVARIEAGQRVLIHLIASAESQAAAQLSLALDAEVFVTVSSLAERSLLRDNYKIPDNRIFDSMSRALSRSLATATNGKGFDVIISDHEGVPLRQASMCLAELGCLVDISQKVRGSDLSTDIFQKNISFSTVDIQKLSPAKFKDLFQRTIKMLQEGSNLACRPTPKIFSISSLGAAQGFLVANPGTIAVVSFDDSALIPILPAKPSPLVLSPSATYLIAGGLGALGLVDTPLCDVTDEAQVEDVMRVSKENGWSIRGLVQCAMVLRVKPQILS
jgi:NADPH:quinone reductase-like Zn-dependent oxidoreductase